MIRPSLLALGLLAATSAATLQAQTHLGVPAKDMTTIQVNLIDDGSGTLTKLWTEKRFGTATTVTADTYTPSKKETLVITDAEFTVFCSAASASAPLFSPIINDAAGAGWIYPTRFRPTLTTPGIDPRQLHQRHRAAPELPVRIPHHAGRQLHRAAGDLLRVLREVAPRSSLSNLHDARGPDRVPLPVRGLSGRRPGLSSWPPRRCDPGG